MAIDYDKIMSLETKNQEFSYSDRETMLYGLGIGCLLYTSPSPRD